MIDACVVVPSKIDGTKLKSLNNEDRTKVLSGHLKSDSNPLLEIPTTKRSIVSVRPKAIINNFSNIMGVTPEQAKDYYNLGARSVEELERNHRRFKLNATQLLGCKYYNNILTPITEIEEIYWKNFIYERVNTLPYHIFDSNIQSRPMGIHSRIEVCICVTGVSSSVAMSALFDHFGPTIMSDTMHMYEIYNYPHDDESPKELTRIKTMGNIHDMIMESGLETANVIDRKVLIDITIYQPQFYPYPSFRQNRSEWESLGYIVTDVGLMVLDEDGTSMNKANFRDCLGRDNPSNIEEIKELISSQ